MGERKAVNKYYPPDWRPEYGSLTKYHGQHPLHERARKIHEGIIIIRFELPYNIWCGGCGIHIAKGKRFNAEKKCVGNYFSTKIFKFRMRCHLCPNYFEIQTDPQHSDYVIVSGASRKVETWQSNPEETGTVALKDDDEAKRLIDDPFYKLEHKVDDEKKGVVSREQVTELLETQQRMHHDYAMNSQLRNSFREEKVELRKQKADGKKLGLATKLLPPSESDAIEAAKVSFMKPLLSADQTLRKRQNEITSASIFGAHTGGASAADLRQKRLRLLDRAAHLHVDPTLLSKHKPTTHPPTSYKIVRTNTTKPSKSPLMPPLVLTPTPTPTPITTTTTTPTPAPALYNEASGNE
ncbi:CWC16 protein [Pelomyxa schiedti]|nr:CWC16 protein [Pelomyxa schiedti]